MAVVWGPRPNEMTDSDSSVVLPYVLTGETNPLVARALAVGFSSALYDNLYRSDITLNEIGPDIFNVDVAYGPIDQREPIAGEFNWTFDTTGKTRHITQGIGLAANGGYVPAGKAKIDHKGAIGVADDGSVEGVDIPDRAFAFSETHQLLLASFGFSYSLILGQYTGYTNIGSFRGLDGGTVRFDGAVGGQSNRDPDLVEITYFFDHSPDETALTIGGIGPLNKPGWHYLWTRYEEEVDAAADKTTPLPRQIDVNQVHNTVDFSVLGIGS